MSENMDRLEFATTIFVRECIRQALTLHPSMDPSENPVKALAEYPPRQRAALMKAILVAHRAMSGENEELFEVFMQQKNLANTTGGAKPSA